MGFKSLCLQNVGGPLLKNISFEVTQPACVVILGNNGSGKTTLLKTIAGLQNDSSGSVLLNGKNVSKMSPSQRALQIAWLPQALPRPFDMTCESFVAIANSQLSHSKFYGALAKFGLNKEFAKRDIASLSGGEWKRVQLAHLECRDACVRILDEPSEGLDLNHTRLLVKNLKAFAQSHLVLLSTHDFNFAFSLADFVIVVNDGRVLWQGSTAALRNSKDVLINTFAVSFLWTQGDTIPVAQLTDNREV